MCHSKIDQGELAHKIAEWLQESPQDIFLLRPSMKSASDSTKTKHFTEQRKKTTNRIEITQKFLNTANHLVL